jgi:hypothetical protein
MSLHAFALDAVKDKMEKELQARQKHTPKHLNSKRLPVLARIGCGRGWGRVLISAIPSSHSSIFTVYKNVHSIFFIFFSFSSLPFLRKNRSGMAEASCFREI